MQVAATIEEMRALRCGMEGSVGLVPTLGFLHEGHLSLVRAARERDDQLIASIFVNPTQFGADEDLARYPRDPERDLKLLRREHVDAVFMPSAEEIYPEGASTFVDVGAIGNLLEGAQRPGHFRGVATVVAQLLHIIQPRRAYFGRKDAQQLAVIEKLVRDLHLDVEIVPLPTIREQDGLALSSRNSYLTPQERTAAAVLWKALDRARELFADGERDGERLRSTMRELIAQEPLAQIDYVSVADAVTWQELKRIERPAIASLAVRFGGTRLIDNVTLERA